MRFLKLVFFVGAAFYLIATLAVFVFQRSLQYFPSHGDPAPDALGLSGVTRLMLVTR